MSGDYCESKTIEVEVQANGIIRNKKGWVIGHLDKGVKYKRVELSFPHTRKRKGEGK